MPRPARTHAGRIRLLAAATGATIALALVAAAFVGAAEPAAAACANPVACENANPGASPSEWDIDGAGSDDIQGFATDISVNAGGKLDLKVKTTARAYTITIYRTGWYQGLGARRIATVTPSATLPQTQPQCITDVATELVDCGNWKVSASWNVPSTAVSGVYVALLSRSDTGGRSHITFVVRNDASRSDIVFQTSDPTWQAYNGYGGSNFYTGGENGRAYKLSYNRPFATRDDNSGRDFYFSGEYAQVRFLERNGYDVTYLAGVDSDRNGALLRNHKVFLSVGHDEYWSGAQRANIEAARDAGVNLQFLGGNDGYWRTRYAPSADASATPYRTLVSYKETWANQKIDPTTQWTGTWRDPRFAPTSAGANRPENALIGTLYMANHNDLPVTVSAAEGKLRLWRGTSLANLATGTSAALAPHTIGYESDEDLDNGSRPPGLVRLSTTTGPTPQYLQDYGNTVLPGTTTHHLTLYRAPSGALVFSAGSIQWAWGLDQEHDGAGAPADQRMQQAQVNLLADMRAFATTLQSGLVAATASTDTTAATASISAPVAGAQIANGSSVVVTGTAADVGGRVAGVEVSTDGGASWHPANGTTTWSYTFVQHGRGAAQIRARAIDDSANIPSTAATVATSVVGPYSVFGAQAPTVVDSGDASAVELGLRFTPTDAGFVSGVRFYKAAANTGVHVGSLWSPLGERLATVTFTGETASGWQKATFSPSVPVTAGTRYTVSYTAPRGHYSVQPDAFWAAGITSEPLLVDGGYGVPAAAVYGAPGEHPTNSFESSNYFVDAVYESSDSTPLAASNLWPLPGSTSVPASTTLSAKFLKAVVSGSVGFTVTDQLGNAVTGATAYDAAARVATFTPSTPLNGFVAYTVVLKATPSGASTPPAEVSRWTFTTVKPTPAAGICPCRLFNDSTTPGVLEVADSAAVTLGVKFTPAVDGTVTGVAFYKGAGNTGQHVGSLWSTAGDQLATATFAGESTSGWQTVSFAAPVSVKAGTQYVAAYRTPVGRYSATLGAFNGSGVAYGPLSAAANAGAYTYGSGYPGSASTSNYLVDVVFEKGVDPIALVSTTPAAGALDVDRASTVSAKLSMPVAPGFSLTVASGGSPVAGTAALSDDRTTITFTASAPLPNAATVTATLTGVRSDAGSLLPPRTWSFTTADSGGTTTSYSLFGSTTPASTSIDDGSGVELGMSFSTTSPGSVTAIRFYKGAGNGGTHTGSLWSASGARLAAVTFADETATGWQTALLDTPVALQPGTEYVVSYYAPQGHYAATGGFFQNAASSGPLLAPSAGNGRYRYGTGGAVPTFTWNQTNYFVDVIFRTAVVAPVTVVSTSPAAGLTDVAVGERISAQLSASPTVAATMTLTGPNGAVAGHSEWDAASNTVSFVPDQPLAWTTSFTAAVSIGGQSPQGGSWSFTTRAQPVTTTSFFPASAVPNRTDFDDATLIQLGVRFTSTQPGTVSGIRFYKVAGDANTHVVRLWAADGTALASATSLGETVSGWQTVYFASPVQIAASIEYRATYSTPRGRYAADLGALAEAVVAAPLSTVPVGGVYVYGAGYPSAVSSHNYWADVLFTPGG
ncbi:hypothetical protein GCM10009717_23240 [Agromyces allii]|uniref:DUF4082 domain-containing protein n=1 Tax=Agromyces allii TaxID=393607 RepID=A0ABN2QQ96_9MICO